MISALQLDQIQELTQNLKCILNLVLLLIFITYSLFSNRDVWKKENNKWKYVHINGKSIIKETKILD